MEDAIMSVKSPCIDLCKMDRDNGWCAGCFRTIPEIKAWKKADDDERRTIVKDSKQRKKAAKKAKKKKKD